MMKNPIMKSKLSLTPIGLAAWVVAQFLIVTLSFAQTAPPSDPKIELKVVKVDSEESNADDNKGYNAVDGNPATFWHTQFENSTSTYPHEITLELVPPATIKGVTYLPRQDDSENGMIKDYEIYVSADGKGFGQSVAKGAFDRGVDLKVATFEPRECRFIKLKALSSVNGGPWASAAEITVVGKNAEMKTTPPKSGLRAVKADSEETQAADNRAANAVDGDPATFWHTQWQDNAPGYPHEIVLELVPSATIKGVTYLPRQDGSENGMIKDYEIYVSADGKDFGQPVAKGAFEKNADMKTVNFSSQACRFVKFKALSEVNNGPWASAAEITIIKN